MFRALALSVAIAFLGLEAATIGATLLPRSVGGLGYEVHHTPAGFVVAKASPEGMLEPGDRIIAIDGDPRAQSAGPAFMLFRRPPGSRYRLAVARDGGVVELSMKLAVRESTPDKVMVCGFLILGLCYHLLGFLAGWSRTGHPTAKALWISSSIYSLVFVARALMPDMSLGSMPDWAYLTGLVFGWDTLWTYLVFAAFPGPVAESAVWKFVRRTVILVSIASFAIAVLRTFERGAWTSDVGLAAHWLYTSHAGLIKQLVLALAVLGKVLIIAVIVRNYRFFSAPAERRRIRLVVGTMVFQMVWLSGFQLSFFAGVPVSQGLTLLSLVPGLLVVVALVYSMRKHNVLGIQVIVRRTVQYALARGTLECISALPFFVVVGRVLVNPNSSSMALISPLPLFGAILAVGLLGPWYRKPLLAALDRVFFRNAMQEERLLHRIVDLTQQQLGFAELLELATQEIELALGPTFLKIEYPAGAEGSRSGPLDREDLAVIPIYRRNGIRAGELRLGPRKSDEPYTESTLRLLRTIGKQLGLALDNHLLALERVDAVMAERTRIAREFHDTLAQGFAGISLHLESARTILRDVPAEVETHLAMAAELARSSSGEARRSVRDLRSQWHTSHDRELLHRLKEVAAKFSSQTLRVEVKHAGERPLPPSVSRNLVRIAQESVTNAVKHAAPSEISIALQFDSDAVQMRITDNGKGFDVGGVSSSGGFGLVGIRERAVEISARLEVTSIVGTGSSVLVDVQC